MIAFSLLKEIHEWHVLLFVIFTSALVFLEWRKKKKRRVLRVLTIILAGISLYIIYLHPVALSEKEDKSILVIGNGVKPGIKDSLLQSDKLEVYEYDFETTLLKTLSSKKVKLSSLNELPFKVDTLFTLGYIPPINPHYYGYRRDLIDDSSQYSISYPKWLKLGEELIIKVNNDSDDAITAKGIVGLDSVNTIVEANTESVILKTTPKNTGVVFGNLQLNDDVYYYHTSIQDEKKYVFHIVSETPDFEWRFLKDYLESLGHAVFYESKISKEKYKSSFSNWPDSLSKQKYSKQPLALDVLLVDMEAWNNMGGQRKNDYSKILNTRQGSLILRANPNVSVSLQSINPTLKNRIFSAKEISLNNGVNLLNISGLNSFQKVDELYLYKNILPTLSIGFLQIQDTYHWSLAGKKMEYRNYWSSVLNQLMRTHKSEYSFTNEWPVVYQPFHASFWSAQPLDSIEVIWNGSDTLRKSVVQDPVFNERYQLVFYPEKVGQYQLSRGEKSSDGFFYVHPDSTYSQLLMESSYNYNFNSYLSRINDSHSNNSSNNKEDSLTFWFFLLFLLSISFLWIEEKI
ncbi:hypothetical protein C9994_01505 [Marivirga lumbricoides]|uniref:Uncharacterized protein n=1 Tax=Marivirga lumbricoides TaxID=1046115 RepID=A0A2T4DVD4_9BACT|nr:hypothetical protein C9994_01505 [Marivirga lumbricoides]